ncbi:MAG: tetratricopeptide repeat protein [Gemmatimonadota bacterium]
MKERTVPHGSFTDHWIRVVRSPSAPARARRAGDDPVEPYFDRDGSGPEAEIYRGMGEMLYATRAGDPRLLREAARSLDRALGSDTTHDDAHFLLGLAHRQLGRTEDAIRALERSLRTDPDRPHRLHALARAYESAGRDPAAIDRLYERALELQPALAWIRADHADFLQAQGRRAEAEAAYRAALTERPSLAVAAFNLGTLLTGLGRLGEAAESFERAVRLDPSLGEAVAALLQVRTRGTIVTDVRLLGSPLATLPVRDRGRAAIGLRVAREAAEPAVGFVNVPPGASVRVLEPDGALVRALPVADGPDGTWDLRTATGDPIAGGLYQVHVQGADATGRPSTPRRLFFGVVRVGGP